LAPAGILLAAFASALAGAQATTPGHRADIKRAVYDLCPKVFAGEVLLTDAGTAGFHVGDPMSLGDGTMIIKAARKKGTYTTMAVIVADAGGEFGSSPAATVVLMK
jgi:hypothetical protein